MQLEVLNTAYYAIVVGLTMTALYQSSMLGFFYLRGPTYMDTKIVDQMEADFPAITICNMNPCDRGEGSARNCSGQHLCPIRYLMNQ